jgi:hypothetical protein
MVDAVQLWSADAVFILGYTVGFYLQHRQKQKVAASLDRCIDDLRLGMKGHMDGLGSDTVRSEMNARCADLHELVKSEVKRLEDRLERIEHSTVRE